ncbi:hypothetical protein Scep_024508 [Stephania cephalantha]|uniref:Uncharacterized protein n=1 Tax=Stephania cephalantha TaxID=152367 RepID=A0AAP0F3W8_9MAGN
MNYSSDANLMNITLEPPWWRGFPSRCCMLRMTNWGINFLEANKLPGIKPVETTCNHSNE